MGANRRGLRQAKAGYAKARNGMGPYGAFRAARPVEAGRRRETMATTKTRPKAKFIEFPKDMEQRITLALYALEGITTEELKTLGPLLPHERFSRLRFFLDQAAARTGA